jgi:hypothetical protein
MNLALGSALACIGLTIPVVVLAATVFALPLVLGLEPKDLVLLMVTFLTSAVTLGSGRTHMMQGAVHLVIFAAFLFLAFVPWEKRPEYSEYRRQAVMAHSRACSPRPRTFRIASWLEKRARSLRRRPRGEPRAGRRGAAVGPRSVAPSNSSTPSACRQKPADLIRSTSANYARIPLEPARNFRLKNQREGARAHQRDCPDQIEVHPGAS